MSSHLTRPCQRGQRDSKLLLAPVQDTTSTHNTTEGGDLKANVFMIHKPLVFAETNGGFRFPSTLIKCFDPLPTCSAPNAVSPWPDGLHAGPLPLRIHSQCNYWQTKQSTDSQWKRCPSPCVQPSQWNPDGTFVTSRSPSDPQQRSET